MIATILTITILGYYINSCMAYGKKLSTCKV